MQFVKHRVNLRGPMVAPPEAQQRQPSQRNPQSPLGTQNQPQRRDPLVPRQRSYM